VLDCSLYVQLFYDLYYCHKGMDNITVHTYIRQCNNTTIKNSNCNANIYFKQGCIKNSIIPQYAKLQIPHMSVVNICGGAGKSLGRPTSWCHRTESIVLFERGVCSCAELQVFFCYRGWKEACQVTCNFNIETRAVIKFFSCEVSHWGKFTPFRQKQEGNVHHRMQP
jgi:hypothetical protein